jgi:hypothetical protein
MLNFLQFYNQPWRERRLVFKNGETLKISETPDNKTGKTPPLKKTPEIPKDPKKADAVTETAQQLTKENIKGEKEKSLSEKFWDALSYFAEKMGAAPIVGNSASGASKNYGGLTKEGLRTAYGKGSTETAKGFELADGKERLKHVDAVAKLYQAAKDNGWKLNIVSSSGTVNASRQKGTTGLEGMQNTTVDGFVKLMQSSGAKNVTITAGTENGHSDYKFSHGNGYKMDLSKKGDSNMLWNCADNKPGHSIEKIAVGYRKTFYENGYRYRIMDEGDHYDLEVVPVSGKLQEDKK